MPRTIAITFAGRQDRMPLLVRHMKTALDRGIVDEWHVWNYARTPRDAEWVASLASEKIKIMVPSKIVAHKYEDCYKHYYSDNTTYAPDDVFLKLDDDIVYIDLEGLEHMISFRRLNPQYYLVSANVVNNATCYLFQREVGVWADLPPLDSLMTSGEQAAALHRAFLGGEKVLVESVADLDPKYILNINCVCWLGKDLDSVSICESTSINGDEVNLSNAFPRIFNRPVCIFGPCVVAHLSFHTQDASMPIGALLDEYAGFDAPHTMPPI